MNQTINTKATFDNLPFDEWLEFPELPKQWFHSFFSIIDQPELRPGIIVNFDFDTNKFMKVKHNPF